MKPIKQDINFLDKPLWFQNVRPSDRALVWKDIDGYEYRSGYKLPDKTDMLFLLYFLYLSQKQNYTQNVIVSRYEVVKSCGFSTGGQYYYKRLEDSLERWKNVTIKFDGTFCKKATENDHRYIFGVFGIINESWTDENGQVKVEFNKSWLSTIQVSDFYKYLNFNYYKALKRPLSRRLFELLCKNFKGRNEHRIGVVKLGKKLTLSGRKKKNGEVVIYATDVISAIVPAINEINRLAKNQDIVEKTGILPENLFTISYQIYGNKNKQVILFAKHPVVINSTPDVTDGSGDDLSSLFKLMPLKRLSKNLREAVDKYYREQGYSYVEANILYTNNKAKKSYGAYLQKALDNNWGEDWFTQKQENEQKQKEIEQKIALATQEKQVVVEDKSKQTEQESQFHSLFSMLDETKKRNLWSKAALESTKEGIHRTFAVKLKFAGLVLEMFQEQGFCINVDAFKIAKSIKYDGKITT